MSWLLHFQVQSTLIVFVLFIGIYFRKRRKFHVPIMLTGILWDILLVLQIELDRQAVAKAVKVVENPMILTIHIALALCTVLMYGVMIWSGRKILKGNHQIRSRHALLGFITMGLRILTYITSYFAA